MKEEIEMTLEEKKERRRKMRGDFLKNGCDEDMRKHVAKLHALGDALGGTPVNELIEGTCGARHCPRCKEFYLNPKTP